MRNIGHIILLIKWQSMSMWRCRWSSRKIVNLRWFACNLIFTNECLFLNHLKSKLLKPLLNVVLTMQRMERDSMLFTMESGRNLSLITITTLMGSSLRMAAHELLHFLCICKPLFAFHILVLYCALWWNCIQVWQFFVFGPYEGLTLKKVARLYFLMLSPTLILYPNILERVYQWNQKWVMLCCFGAWSQMAH